MASKHDSPLEPFVRNRGLVVLDGGLATALEDRGHDLDDPLWSAKLLIEAPDAIRDMHEAYLAAGADCITTATYQATLQGFRRRGVEDAAAEDLMRSAVRLAVEARQKFWAGEANRSGRLRPLVAASIGPYGAYLADGSEYRGDYDVTDAQLDDFHRDRLLLLAATEADLLACETIPSGREAAVLLRILQETPGGLAWMSFCCRGDCLRDGTPLKEVAQACDAEPKVVAIGINCTAPADIPALIAAARDVTDKMLIVYPNLGERYDAGSKTWAGDASAAAWLDAVPEWIRRGAAGVGGCCRVGPALIAELRRRLLETPRE